MIIYQSQDAGKYEMKSVDPGFILINESISGNNSLQDYTRHKK